MRRRRSSRLGKKLPVRTLGTARSRSPACVVSSFSRCPLRQVVRVSVCSPGSAPMRAVASASMSSCKIRWARTRTNGPGPGPTRFRLPYAGTPSGGVSHAGTRPSRQLSTSVTTRRVARWPPHDQGLYRDHRYTTQRDTIPAVAAATRPAPRLPNGPFSNPCFPSRPARRRPAVIRRSGRGGGSSTVSATSSATARSGGLCLRISLRGRRITGSSGGGTGPESSPASVTSSAAGFVPARAAARTR